MDIKTIFLHGALGSAAQFEPIADLLKQSELYTAINLPGHGGLPLPPSFSLEMFGAALAQNITQPVRLLGYSMGGYVALFMAWKYPELVSSVVTLNTKLHWTPEVAQRMQGMMNTEKIEAKAPQMAAAFAAAHAPADWKEVAKLTGDLMQDFGNGLGLQTSQWSDISCPVKILRGAADMVVSAEECHQVLDLLKLGTYAELADSGHLLEQVKLSELLPYIT